MYNTGAQAQKDKATFAFIEFESEDSARAAVASTNVSLAGVRPAEQHHVDRPLTSRALMSISMPRL